ncbi:MAG: hypothetical protein ACJ74Q_06825 [Pyrinomonadaceae bacterium]
MRRRTLLIVTLAFAVVACWSHVHAAKVSTHETAARAADAYAPPIPSPTSPRKIDEYGKIVWSDEKARLDNFARELKSTPDGIGYIICYGGRVGRAGEAQRRCRRATDFVVGRYRIKSSRVVATDGGFKEDLTVELWIEPFGVMPPMPSPTVDPSEATILKRKPARKHKSR